MGTLTYMGSVVEFDDVVLSHLQVVVMQKFRRGEAFSISWVDDVAIGDGRSAMWLTPTVPIFFKFDGARVPPIDRAWIDLLARAADGPRGLIVTDPQGSLIPAKGLGHRPSTTRTADRL